MRQYCGPACCVVLAHGQGLAALVIGHWQLPGLAAKVLQGRHAILKQTNLERLH